MIATRRVLLTLALALWANTPVRAQTAPPRDSDVKATYLLNFSRFTKWPAAANESDAFALCVLGRDPFGNALDAVVSGETIDDKRVTIRRIARPQDAAGCRVVFISASEDANVARVLQALGGSHALTVSDVPAFLDRGGMIQLITEGRRIRFSINVAAAGQAGLTFSSELLRVAVTVKSS